MPDSIWDSPLAVFRDRLASLESVPAGVSTAAVSSAFALGLLIKVLGIAAKRKDFQGDRALASSLTNEARTQCELLSRYADEDIDAFRQRSPAVIEVPLKIARALVKSVALCDQARPLIHAAVAPDLRGAVAILHGALHATLFSLEANLEQLPAGDPFREEVTTEARQLLQQCESTMLLWPPFR